MKKIKIITAALACFLYINPSLAIANAGHEDGSENKKNCSEKSEENKGHNHDKKDAKKVKNQTECDSDHDDSAGNNHHKFAHPFFAHMGLPDEVGEFNVRLNAISQRSGSNDNSDRGVHVEAGIAENWGFHYRNDGWFDSAESEIMLQRTVFTDKAKTGGIALFGQYSIYDDKLDEEEEEAGVKKRKDALDAFGISGSKILSFAALNANIHYNKTSKMFEWESSSVFKLNSWIFPLVEIRGEIENSNHQVYVLPGVKFKIFRDTYLGLGAQMPISNSKEYDSQVLLQLDASF